MDIRIKFLGCGEAFDNDLFNTSMLVDAGRKLLLDCGYSIPARLWQAEADHSAIDLIYISHAHADHYFGLPAVLGRMWEEGRTKPLVILSQPSVLDQIRQTMELAYAGLSKRFQYPIQWMEARPGQEPEWSGFRFGFAPTRHSATNLAVSMKSGGSKICYSGDGMFTDESRALFQDADVLVHEAYSFEESAVHADIDRLIAMASEERVKHLVLTHVRRDVRRQGEIRELVDSSGGKITMPEPFHVVRPN